ncbi:MAG: TIR domain-containing protein [Dehalococcoidia bacterium]
MGILDWTVVNTPDSAPYYTKEILNPSNAGISIIKLAVSMDGFAMWAIIRRGDRNGLSRGGAQSALYKSSSSGILWDDAAYVNLTRAQSTIDNGTLIWDMSMAPDDSKFIAVVCSDIKKNPVGQEIWISADLGIQWQKANWASTKVEANGSDFISSLCVSPLLSNNFRYLLVGTRDGTGTKSNNIHVCEVQCEQPSHSISRSAVIEISNGLTAGDILAAKFSSVFEQDRSVVVIYASNVEGHEGTWLSVGKLDIENGIANWQFASADRELRDSSSTPGSSPKIHEIIKANFELPFDFSAANLERSLIYAFTDVVDGEAGSHADRGLFRITNGEIVKIFGGRLPESDRDRDIHICSISYFGTCQSGKLLVGESLGNSDFARVQTWLSHNLLSDQVNWYKSIKQPTGAAKIYSESAQDKVFGFGNAQVQWSHVGQIAFAATGAASLGPWAKPEINADSAIVETINWPAGLFNVVPNDESALSLSRNNGETWNQLSLINTVIAKLTDVAPSMDCTTIYLASVSSLDCSGFASIWRTTINPNVAAPLPAIPPAGTVWERVFICDPHSEESVTKTKYPIIRVVEENYGESYMAACSFQGSNLLFWSPDYGDFWTQIQIKSTVQDFTFGSSVIIYLLSSKGIVERIAYTGIGWKDVRATDTNLGSAHNISTIDEKNILVGAAADASIQSVALSNDGGKTWALFVDQIPGQGNIHVAFDPDYESNGFIYVACDSKSGSIFRNNFPSYLKWQAADLMPVIQQKSGTVSSDNSSSGGKYGLSIAKTGMPESALYVASCNTPDGTNRVYRTLNRKGWLPAPGVSWDSLDIFSPSSPLGTKFSLEPSSLKIAGCRTLDTNATIFAIDDDLYAGNHNVRNGLGNMKSSGERGMLWSYTDCIAKKGPILTMNDDTIIDCEPLTYFNKAIFFTWEQLCIATKYELQIAKDINFNLIIADISDFSPISYSSPALAYFVGNNLTSPETTKVPGLECNEIYYWRCRVISSANGADVKSPWSEARKFSINMESDNKSIVPIIDKGGIPDLYEYDFFISYAYEDHDFVTKLTDQLRSHYKVWYDQEEISAGASIIKGINEGLSKSKHGLVILSPNYFAKNLTQRELAALITLGKRIIAIRLNIGQAEILRVAPIMADIRAIDSSIGIKKIVTEIRKAIEK